MINYKVTCENLPEATREPLEPGPCNINNVGWSLRYDFSYNLSSIINSPDTQGVSCHVYTAISQFAPANCYNDSMSVKKTKPKPIFFVLILSFYFLSKFTFLFVFFIFMCVFFEHSHTDP